MTDKDTIVERAVREARDPAWRRRNWAVVVVLVVAVAVGTWSIVNLYVHTQQNAAEQSMAADAAQRLAEQVRQLGGRPVVQPPTPIAGTPGAPGQPGAAGRGITGTQITGGHLIVAYTDGRTQDVGQVVGKAGAAGANGRGITSTSITGGHLMVSYTDHTTADLGVIVGPKGEPGRSVVSVSASADFHLIIAYSDGTTMDAGPLPAGPPGATGATGATGAQGEKGDPGPACPDGYTARAAVITEPDGTQHAGIACVADDDTTTTTTPAPSGVVPNIIGGH
jgi:hypothetical protein